MDKSLWKKFTEGVRPLKNKGGNFGMSVKKIKESKSSDDIEVSFISVDDIKPTVRRNILEADIYLGDVSRIDKSTLNHINKNFLVDARLDLHGNTLEMAFNRFVKFINHNYLIGNRRLLIITGRGNPEKNTGVIRQNFDRWIVNEDVNSKILYVNYASIKDGGDGAFYILLRKK